MATDLLLQHKPIYKVNISCLQLIPFATDLYACIALGSVVYLEAIVLIYFDVTPTGSTLVVTPTGYEEIKIIQPLPPGKS